MPLPKDKPSMAYSNCLVPNQVVLPLWWITIALQIEPGLRTDQIAATEAVSIDNGTLLTCFTWIALSLRNAFSSALGTHLARTFLSQVRASPDV